ncbi:hypothetical protein PR202_gb15615 [Eleusine coracana subsp. coracana]|uniref:Uncharacterized protein n=1 Tax=Eleusine coracana subsp. coracana TaxID=191504 RepID=A0AAV5EW01_ELECO|nr:hypothetical protein PR202_gb15615 [Eleusine coracana subsp. coracana]
MEAGLVRLDGGDVSHQRVDIGGEGGDEQLQLVKGGLVAHGGRQRIGNREAGKAAGGWRRNGGGEGE